MNKKIPELKTRTEKSPSGSRLLIEGGSFREDNYENKVLQNSRIPGSLPFRPLLRDEDVLFSYDISSMESLDSRCREKKLDYRELSVLMESLNGLLLSLEEYLLPEKLILLEPSLIYYHPEEKRYLFPLLPERENHFPLSLRALLRRVLEEIDYRSERSIILAYSLFRESCREDFRMEELMRIVRKNRKKAGEERQRAEGGEREKRKGKEKAEDSDLRESLEKIAEEEIETARREGPEDKLILKNGILRLREEREKEEENPLLLPAESGSLMIKETELTEIAEAEKKRQKLRKKQVFCLFLMLLLPLCFYLFRGLPFLLRMLPLIFLLECALLCLLLFDLLLAKLPEEKSREERSFRPVSSQSPEYPV